MSTLTSTATIQGTEETPRTGPELRSAQRVPYRALVLAAPYDGKRLPEREEFFEVKTRDLSPTGISFEAEAPPATRRMVLLFGPSGQTPIYVVARVVHFTEYSANSGPLFVIGCELLERLHAEAE